MKKVIAFSLYQAPDSWEKKMDTNYKKYLNGLKINMEDIKNYYSDWFVYLYHDENLDKSLLDEFKSYDKFTPFEVTDKSISAMQWRFLPNDDESVELFIVRDMDSRISQREVTSVNEWIDSGKVLHIMRDHPHHHYKILGGMWGMRCQRDFNITEECRNYNTSKGYVIDTGWYDKWWDMNFLRDVVYPKYIDSSFVNASYHKMENWATDFTVEREDRKFIGEIYNENNERGYHYNLL